MRREMGRYEVVLALILALGVSVGIGPRTVAAQVDTPGASPGTGTPAPPVGGARMPEPDDPYVAAMRKQQQATQQNDRHKKMVSDADKLLQLATELKADVDKSTANETSVSAYMKAGQIEKLAHNVKEELKN